MINLVNNDRLTLDQRRDILTRALHSQPFFHLLNFELAVETIKRHQYAGKVAVNKDYWVTEIKGNFGEVFNATASEFNLSLYTAQTGRSLINYIKTFLLPSAFQTVECRFNTAFATQRYDDKQYEICPYLIRRGDSVIGNIKNISNKAEVADAKCVLAGYYTVNNYLNDRALQGVNESLAMEEMLFETWNFTVDYNGQKAHILQNDRYARVVLGFGIVDKNTVKVNLSEATLRISDAFRGLKFSDDAIPIEFYAPRLTCLRDTHCYYLPVEYFLEPFAPLKFEIDNDLNDGDGFDFVMFTRTV